MTAPSSDLVGETLSDGRYAIARVLGRGSMGHVYLAKDTRLDQNCVVKVPTASRLEDPEFKRRFLLESRFLVKLNHRAIVAIRDVGVHDGVPYFVMQHIEGGSLRDRMRRPARGNQRGGIGALKVHTLNRWLPDVADALDFMHRQKCLHRDVKPANILFDREKHPYLSDFGLSKLLDVDEDATAETADEGQSDQTGAGSIVGTPNYVAPEIILGQDYDGRADQYSLAITCYEVLTARPPLEGPTATATMVNQTAKLPRVLHEVNARIPEGVSAAIHRALSKDPARRFASCREFAESVLEGMADADASSASSDGGHSSSTLVHQVPQYLVVGATKVIGGIGSCPNCSRELKLQAMHAGKKGRCVDCGAKLAINRSITQIKHLKLSPLAKARAASSQSAIDKEFSLVLGQKAFGFEFSPKVAVGIISALSVLILLGVMAFGFNAARAASKPDKAEAPNKVHYEGSRSAPATQRPAAAP